MPDSGKESTAISSTNKRSISSLKISPKFTPIPKQPQAQAQENANITTPTTNVHPSAGFVSSNPSSAGKSKELTPLEAQAIASQHTIDSAGVISSPDALHTMSAVRRTTSATGSLTKSIMNVSGTSGAVVNNAPGEGKKRSPTITFSDAKTNKYAQIQSQMAAEQGQSQGQLQAKIGGTAPVAPDGILKPGTGATTMPQPPIMPQVGESSSTVGSSNISRHGSILNKSQSTNDRNINVKPTFTDQPSHNPKEPVSAAGKQLSEINTKVLNDGSPLPPSIASPFSAMTPADKVTIDQALPINLSELKLAKEHAYFYVDDLLHTPASSRIPTSSNPERPWSNGSGGSTGTGSTIKPVEGGVAVDANVSLKNNALKTVLNEDNATLSSPLSASISSASVANSNASIMNMLKRESGKNVDPRLPLDDGKLHILFGATGSLSVFKLKQMIKKLEEIYGRDKISIMVILTENATKFFTQRYLRKISLRKNLQLQQQGEQTTKKAGAAESTTETEHPGVAVNTSAPSVTSPTTVAGANETTAVPNETGGQPPPPAQPQPPASAVVNATSNIPQVQQLQGFTQIELPPHIQIWRDQDEWDTWKQRSDPVLHIELRRWADILVVAPLTANTLSKISLGLCDNLLTNVIRAWNPNVPILLAPAMVSSTYNSLMTRKQLKIISEEMPWMTVFKPSEKVMSINGDIGLGGMMDANEIVDKIVMKLGGYPKDEDEDENEGEDDENDDEEEEEEEEEEGEDGSENKEKNDNEDEDEDEDDDDDDEDDDDEDDDDDDDDEEQSNNSVIKTKGDVPQPGTQGAE